MFQDVLQNGYSAIDNRNVQFTDLNNTKKYQKKGISFPTDRLYHIILKIAFMIKYEENFF